MILTPWRDSGCPHREAARAWLADYYVAAGLGPVVYGDSDHEQFNRSAARNAAARASGADVLVFLDADALVTPGAIQSAARVARDTGRLVKPFRRAGFLTQEGTRRLLEEGRWPRTPDTEHGLTDDFVGLGWVIRADSFAKMGGWDEAFEGYGGEDNAFTRACEVVLGPVGSVAGAAYSLWHPGERVASEATWERTRAYWRLQSADDVRRMNGAAQPPPR